MVIDFAELKKHREQSRGGASTTTPWCCTKKTATSLDWPRAFWPHALHALAAQLRKCAAGYCGAVAEGLAGSPEALHAVRLQETATELG
jgi:hypothetical protein